MRIGILGINHKLADLKLRETLAKVCQRHFAASNRSHEGHHLVLLSTCNRTEVYFSSEELASTHSYLLGILRNEVKEEIEQKLYSFFGYDCLLHLARVTAGLDSAVIAETEIQGQVKGAYEFAADFSHLPSELHYAFQKSLKIGKEVRSNLAIKRGLPELEHAVFSIGDHFFAETSEPSILVVGASEINRKIVAHLVNRKIGPVSLCNRTLRMAEEWKEIYGVQVVPWNKLGNWHRYDWIIFGTKSADHLAVYEDIPANLKKKRLLIDLSVPRNIDPVISRDPRMTLLNIDQINRSLRIRRRRMIDNLLMAENQLAEATRQQVQLYQEKERRRQTIAFVA